MRRLLRWAFNGLAAVSLLLCVGVCVLWVRSYWVGDLVRWWDKTGHIEVATSRGDFGWLRNRIKAEAAEFWALRYASPFGWHYEHGESYDLAVAWAPYLSEKDVSFFGPHYRAGKKSYWDSTQLVLPLWLPTALLATPPAAWAVLARRRRRARRRLAMNLCPRCGYDLRATPDHCPECGTPTLAKGATA